MKSLLVFSKTTGRVIRENFSFDETKKAVPEPRNADEVVVVTDVLPDRDVDNYRLDGVNYRLATAQELAADASSRAAERRQNREKDVLNALPQEWKEALAEGLGTTVTALEDAVKAKVQ